MLCCNICSCYIFQSVSLIGFSFVDDPLWSNHVNIVVNNLLIPRFKFVDLQFCNYYFLLFTNRRLGFGVASDLLFL